MSCDQLRHFSVDSGITGWKYVRDDTDIGQRGAAQSREPRNQGAGRIKWRAWKRAEAGDKNGRHAVEAINWRLEIERAVVRA